MKQASPDRIRELLRILDWVAAPFGTQEDLLLSYGLSGTDYTLDADNQPKPTPTGTTNALRAVAAPGAVCVRSVSGGPGRLREDHGQFRYVRFSY